MYNPCHTDCKERSAICHGACEKYKRFKEEIARANEKRKEEQNAVADMLDSRREMVKEYYRKKRRGARLRG